MIAKMNNPPVFYTVAQIKFNPISNMADYVPKLQKDLRSNGYPGFKEEIIKHLNVRRDDVLTLPLTRWSFTNTEHTEGYILFSDSLAFYTTKYDNFEDFLQKILNGLQWVHELIGLAYTERIGLRYLNAFIPKSEENLEEYLNPSLIGLSSIIEGKLMHNYNETAAQINNDTLVIRSIINENKLSIPADLQALNIPIKLPPTIPGRGAIVDTDYFTTQQFNYDFERVKNQLKLSHKAIKRIFSLSATDFALKAWS